MDYQTLKPVTTSRQTNKQKKRLTETTFQIITITFLQNPMQQNPFYKQSKSITSTKLQSKRITTNLSHSNF